jgi:antitoxin VapB
MYPDDPVSGSTFTTERNVDARPASASDLAVRRGVNSFTRTAEGRSAVKTIEDGVDGPPSRVYMLHIYFAEERAMTKAKLFTTGGSQAVRLPAEFRFEGSEVDIRRDPVTGEVVLSKPTRSWDDYFDWARTLDLPDDFLAKRDQPKDDLRDRLPTPRRKRG